VEQTHLAGASGSRPASIFIALFCHSLERGKAEDLAALDGALDLIHRQETAPSALLRSIWPSIASWPLHPAAALHRDGIVLPAPRLGSRAIF